jgi:hypothetical protein
MAKFEFGLQKIAGLTGNDAKSDRNLIASVLLDAVEQSFNPYDYKARRWLKGTYAQTLLLLLDISPDAALHNLAKKWTNIDQSAPAPGQWLH